MMLQYVRDNKERKIGVLVAMLNGQGEIVVGHSKWNRKRDKEYNIERGRQIATDRAEKDSCTPPAQSLKNDYLKFLGRAARYFKVKHSDNTLEATKRMLQHKE